MKIARRETVAVTGGVLLVAAAFVVPHLDIGITPLINASPVRFTHYAGVAPLFGWWSPQVGWGTIAAVLLGVAAVLWGPTVAQRLPWRALTLTTWATSAVWAFSLAMIDGWDAGFVRRLADHNEYLHEVPGVTDIGVMLDTFTNFILNYQPHSWVTHVSGHPPGALLTFVWMDRIGLGGSTWAGWLCVLAGSSAAAAIIIAIRALSDEPTARLAAPFVALAPTAIWIAVSADGYFAGVAAWGIALLALAVRRTVRWPLPAAAAAGLLLGWGVFLNYGLTLMALPALAVLLCASDWRNALRALVPALSVALSVAVVFLIAGFWWFEGYTLVQERYWQGIASDRPFEYWVWGNLASVVCAIGLASVAGLSRIFDIAAIKRQPGLYVLILGFLAAIICADLSMLSKAETERIWLPFTVWLPAAAALLPLRSHRWWLAVNIIGALVLNHLIYLNW